MNNKKTMFGGIEVISYDLNNGNRDSKMEKALKEGLFNYGVKKGYIKPKKRGLKMINTLKKHKKNPAVFNMIKCRINDLKQLETSPLRVGSDIEAINILEKYNVCLNQVNYDLNLQGYKVEALEKRILESGVRNESEQINNDSL